MNDTEIFSAYSDTRLRELVERIENELAARERAKEQHEDAIDSSIREAIEDNHGVIFTLFYDDGDTDVFRLDENTHYVIEVERKGD